MLRLRDQKTEPSQREAYPDLVASQCPAISVSEKAGSFANLKQQMAKQQVADMHYLGTGISGFDTALSGGLAHRHVHLITTSHGDAAATGFIVSLLRAQLVQRPEAPIIWCSPRFSGLNGHLCAEGLWAMGLDPSKVIFIHDAHPARLLSAFEEALQTKGVAGGVAEYGLLAGKSAQWLRWAQRLRRAARAGDSLGFLLGPPAASTGFETGWSVSARPTDEHQHQDGKQDWRPRWSVRLTKSRTGHQASADIRYCPISGKLHLVRDIMAEQPAISSTSDPISGPVSGDIPPVSYLHHRAS